MDDIFCDDISRCSLCTEYHGDRGFRLVAALDIHVFVNSVQGVHLLAFVLMKTFYLYVDDGIFIQRDILCLIQELFEIQFAVVFDLLKFCKNLLVVFVFKQFFQLVGIFFESRSDQALNILCQFTVAEAASIVKAYNKNILFHVDAVQGFGKYRIYPKKMGIDMLSVSGHKIHGPKGIGFLYINEKAKVKPIIFGGEQQKNMRSGTENVPGIAGIGVAAKEIYTDLDEKVAHMRALKKRFIEGISKIEHTTIHRLADETSAPHIISVGIAGIRSEVLLHTLEDKGIYVSSGSACASNHPAVSGVLKGIGAGKEYLDATLRFSMSEFTTEEEIDYTLETLYTCVPMLRKYTRH